MSASSGETESVISSIADESEVQVIDEPNLIRLNLKLGTVNYVVLEDAEGKHVFFNRNFAPILNITLEPSSNLMIVKHANLAYRYMQKKYEDAFLLDKSNKPIISTMKKEYSDIEKACKGQT